jgi:antitoxin component YwqK of YwqJK toxin-antitoxin module
MKNIRIIFINILLFLVCGIAFAENIEFRINRYKNFNDYDVIYFQNNKQIVKDVYKNNKFIKREGVFPEGEINFINYLDIVVANVNIKNNKFDGLCTFFKINDSNTTRIFNLCERIESNYKNGILNGETKIFDNFDRITSVLNYEEGKLNGPSIYIDYDNGLKKTIEFVDGIKKSEFVTEYTNNEKK